MVAGAVLLGALAILAESRAAEPMIPLRLFRTRTITLAVVASIAVGVAMFGASVFLGQYFQISRGAEPDHVRPDDAADDPRPAGRLHRDRPASSPGPAAGSATWSSARSLLTVGFALMGTMRADTSFALLSRLHGADRPRPGHDHAEPGARRAEHRRPARARRGQLGGRLLPQPRRRGRRLARSARCSATRSRTTWPRGSAGSASRRQLRRRRHAIPDVHTLPGPIRAVVESAYGHGAGDIFLAAAPFGADRARSRCCSSRRCRCASRAATSSPPRSSGSRPVAARWRAPRWCAPGEQR